MANTSSAKKAQRASLRRRIFNLRRTREMKESAKKISKLIQAKDAEKAEAFLPKFQKAVDKAAKRGVIKANTATRMKSRIAKRIRALAG